MRGWGSQVDLQYRGNIGVDSVSMDFLQILLETGVLRNDYDYFSIFSSLVFIFISHFLHYHHHRQ